MKNLLSFLVIIFLSFSSYSQIRKIGSAVDSINFSSIVTSPDSSIYFVGSKGFQHVYILKTNRQLDTLWSKIISTSQSYSFPNAIYMDQSNELLVNCSSNILIKIDASGNLIFKKEISIPGTISYGIRSTLVKNDSLLFAVNNFDSNGYHCGIAVADTSGNIFTFHDFGAREMGKIMAYNGGYYISGSGVILDANFNIVEQYYVNFNTQFYTFIMGESTVLNDTAIVGSIVVENNFGPEADEIYKITQNGLHWVVKDDLITGDAAYQITPVKLYPNGNIACVMYGYGSVYIGIVDSNGTPVNASALNVPPDNYLYKIGVCDLNNAIAFAYGNVIGIADTSGATCSSSFGSMDQYNPFSGISDSGSEPDSMYNLNWTVTSLIDSTSQTSLTVDAICTQVGVEDLSEKNGIVIYPNPWKNHFQITGLKHLTKISIVDISGKVILERFVNCDEQISISQFIASGFYLVKIDGLARPLQIIKLEY